MKTISLRLATALVMFMLFMGCSSDQDSSSCPPGFTGTGCLTKITPTKIKITKVIITQYPAMDGTSPWDNGEDTSGAKPDIWFAISQGATLLAHSDYLVDASGAITFNFATPYEITNVSALYDIYLYDFDGGDLTNSEDMAWTTFNIYKSFDIDFPDHITAQSIAAGFTADIYVTYEW